MFAPSVDREGRPIDQEYWTAEALAVFGKLFRGATAFPRGRGVWRDDERDGQLIHDDTQMVTSYVALEALSDSGVLSVLREFLCRLGIHGNQGEVGIVIAGSYFGIVDYGELEDGE